MSILKALARLRYGADTSPTRMLSDSWHSHGRKACSMNPLHRAMSRRLLIRLAFVASVAPFAGGAAEEPVQIYAAATFRTVLEKVLSA